MTVVCGAKLLPDIRELIPTWCGIRVARINDGTVTISDVRKPKQNPSQDRKALARMLWKDEALRCLKQYGHKTVTWKHSAEEIWKEAAKRLDVKTLAEHVRSAIKARGGSGFEKQSIQGDGSCTIESTDLEHYYSENLAWLLSQQSKNLLH